MPAPPEPPLAAAAAAFGAGPADLESLGAFESEVFAFTGPAGPSVLKIIAPEHRSPEQVAAEIDWLIALDQARVPVARPIPSVHGNLVETFEGYVAVAFRRAPGSLLGVPQLTNGMTREWGRLLGKLQRHSRTYRPPGPQRCRILETTYLTRWHTLGDSDQEFAEAAKRHAERLAPQLAAQGDAGLVHADLHLGNLLWNGSSPTAIDFDDSGYADYSYDLGIALYYALRGQRGRHPLEVTEEFVPPFLAGFLEEAPLPGGGAEAVALAMDARRAEMVIMIRLKLRPEKLTSHIEEIGRELRDAVVAGEPMVPPEHLDRLFRRATG